MRPHCVVASCARSITHTDALPRVLGGVYHCAHLDRRISRPKSERHPYDGNHMKAVVMAGGGGLRPRPPARRPPKPLRPVAGPPANTAPPMPPPPPLQPTPNTLDI